MSKRYALETIAAAKELYLQDSSLREIARETGRNASAALVLKWCRKYGWPEEKAALEARALARVAEETEELREKAMADTVRNQVAAYRTLWERGVSELMNLEITRPSDG